MGAATGTKGLGLQFDGKDFPNWKYAMETLLLRQGVLDIVRGTTLRPTLDATNADDVADFDKRSMVAYTTIVLSMSRNCLKYTRKAAQGDARAVWLELCHHFERNTRANKRQLRAKFHSIKITESESIANYFDRLNIIVSSLESMGERISDDEKLAATLNGLANVPMFKPIITI